MKICLINNLYEPYSKGGAEKIVEIMANGLLKLGHQVVIITTKPISIKNFNLEIKKISPKFKIYYIPALYYNLNKLPKSLRFFWHIADTFDIGSYFKIKGILKKEKPNLVITHNLKGIGYLIPLAIRNLKIKHIHILHDVQLALPSGLMIYGKEKELDDVFVKSYGLICRLLFGSPYLVISPSKWLSNFYQKKGFFKKSLVKVIPNPITSNKIENSETKSKQTNETFKFLYVGQIEKSKGIFFLLDTLAKLSGIDCKLSIIGDGSLLEELEIKAESNFYKNKKDKGLKSKQCSIEILGKKSHKEVEEKMLKSDCLIVPSLNYENSPTVIYEALLKGLPVIASNLGGISELVEDKFLFRPKDKDDLISKIKYIVKNKPKANELKSIKLKLLNAETYIKKIFSSL